MKKEEDSGDNAESSFNGSLATLERIDGYVRDAGKYSVNGDLLGMRENLKLLYFETRGFLNKGELKKVDKDYDYIRKFKLSYNWDGSVAFDSRLPGVLDSFFSWLLLKLHRHRVTIAGKPDLIHGLDMVRKKYRL